MSLGKEELVPWHFQSTELLLIDELWSFELLWASDASDAFLLAYITSSIEDTLCISVMTYLKNVRSNYINKMH